MADLRPGRREGTHRRAQRIRQRSDGRGLNSMREQSLAKAEVKTPRFGWALTGSGHFFRECLELMQRLQDLDLFVSKAAAEVVRMYRQRLALPPTTRIFKDTTASAAPVGNFYYGV